MAGARNKTNGRKAGKKGREGHAGAESPRAKSRERLRNVTFHNVTITILSESARQAYDDLCGLLEQYNRANGGSAIEWETHTYSVDVGDQRETTELWPT